MIGAIGGVDAAIYFRPVERAAPVGPDATAQKRDAGVVDAEGRALSRETGASELSLSQEKRAILAQLRGETQTLASDAPDDAPEQPSAPADEAQSAGAEPSPASAPRRGTPPEPSLTTESARSEALFGYTAARLATVGAASPDVSAAA